MAKRLGLLYSGRVVPESLNGFGAGMKMNDDDWFDVAFGSRGEIGLLINRISNGDLSLIEDVVERVLHQGTLFSMAPSVVSDLVDIAIVNEWAFPAVARAVADIGIFQPQWITLLPPFGVRSISCPPAEFSYPLDSIDGSIAVRCRDIVRNLSTHSLSLLNQGSSEIRASAAYAAFWYHWNSPIFLDYLLHREPSSALNEDFQKLLMLSAIDVDLVGRAEVGRDNAASAFKLLLGATSIESDGDRRRLFQVLKDEFQDVTWHDGAFELPLLSVRAREGAGFSDLLALAIDELSEATFRTKHMLLLTAALARHHALPEGELEGIVLTLRPFRRNFPDEIDVVIRYLST